jgi:hypothetical protein
MTGAVQTADSAAPAAGNATLLSAQPDPAPDTSPPPVEPKDPVEPGPETDPVEPPKEGDEPPKEGEPEAYTFTAPDGVTLDPGAVEAFTPVAQELKLSQEQAQRLVGVYADLQQRQAEAHTAQRDQWAREVVADKELGGAKMVQQVEAANKVLKQFGTPGLNEILQTTGLCNHPEMIRLLARVGREVADDRHTTGGGQPVQPDDFATSYFAKMPKRERVSS